MASPYQFGGNTAAPAPRPSPYQFGGGLPQAPKPRVAAPHRRLNPLDANPSVALANAQQAQGLMHLDAWLKAQQGLARQDARIGTQRLDRARMNDRTSILDNLAARGLGRSGDVGYQQTQHALDFNDKRYDLNAGVLQNLVGYMQNYLQQKQALRNATTSAYQKAYESTYGG